MQLPVDGLPQAVKSDNLSVFGDILIPECTAE